MNLIPDLLAELLEMNPFVKTWYEKLSGLWEVKEIHQPMQEFIEKFARNIK